MATRFVPIDRETPLLLPPNLRDWVPANHLVHFVLAAVEQLDLRQVRVNTRGLPAAGAWQAEGGLGVIGALVGARTLLRGESPSRCGIAGP